MARVHKVSMFVTDIEGDSNLEDLIEYGLNRYDLYPSFIEVKSSEEFEWDDDFEELLRRYPEVLKVILNKTTNSGIY